MSETTEVTKTLDELKTEATELGIEFSANIGATKLQAKIDAFYESKETASKELEESLTDSDDSEVASKDPKIAYRMLVNKMRADANKLRFVEIIDNDQMQNSMTTTCIANCTNQHFDLGTKIIPLNTKVQVRQGHLNALAEVEIPLHVSDRNQTSTSNMRMRKRYSIIYHD